MPTEFPKAWRRARIEEIAEVTTGGTPRRDRSDYWGGEIPWMSSGEVNLRYVREVQGRITDLGLAESNARWLKPGTVMMALAGQGKTRGKVALLETPVTCNQSLAGIAPQDDVDPRFLFQQLESMYSAIRMINGDNIRSGLNLGLIRAIQVVLPPFPEQKKIAAILSSVDDAIHATQAVIEQTRRVKEGLLQDLLTKGIGHTRFKQTEIGEIPIGWRTASVAKVTSDIVDYRGKTPPYSDHGVPVISQEDIQSTGLRPSTKWVSPKTASQWVHRGTLEPGDVVFRMERFVGEVVQVPDDQSYVVTRGVLALRPDPKVMRKDFMFWQFFHKKRRGDWEKHGHATTVPRMYKPDLLGDLLAVPPLAEQAEIAGVMNQVQEAIESNRADLVRLSATKEGLLHDLLTGKVRVSV